MPRPKKSRSKGSAKASRSNQRTATFVEPYLYYKRRPYQGRPLTTRLVFPTSSRKKSKIFDRQSKSVILSGAEYGKRLAEYSTQRLPTISRRLSKTWIPQYARVCAKRRIRREALFKQGKIGSGIRIRRRKRTPESDIKC